MATNPKDLILYKLNNAIERSNSNAVVHLLSDYSVKIINTKEVDLYEEPSGDILMFQAKSPDYWILTTPSRHGMTITKTDILTPYTELLLDVRTMRQLGRKLENLDHTNPFWQIPGVEYRNRLVLAFNLIWAIRIVDTEHTKTRVNELFKMELPIDQILITADNVYFFFSDNSTIIVSNNGVISTTDSSFYQILINEEPHILEEVETNVKQLLTEIGNNIYTLDGQTLKLFSMMHEEHPDIERIYFKIVGEDNLDISAEDNHLLLRAVELQKQLLMRAILHHGNFAMTDLQAGNVLHSAVQTNNFNIVKELVETGRCDHYLERAKEHARRAGLNRSLAALRAYDRSMSLEPEYQGA